MAYFEAIVGPGAKLKFTMLIIEGEPRDVNLARALEDARGNVQHGASRRGNDVGLERSIKSLVGTKTWSMVNCLSMNM